MERTCIYCEMCGKGIRNFKVRKDWGSRPLHLKCWKELEHRKTLEMFAKSMVEDLKRGT